MPIRPTTARCSTKPTTLSCRPGTKPGPWRYEGKTFSLSACQSVGAALPETLSARCGFPATLSPETVEWCAAHRYPYIGLGTPRCRPPAICGTFYADEAAKHGYQAGPENFGYMVATAVGETEEKAQQAAAGFVYGGGQNAFSATEFMMPPGYNSKAAIRNLAKTQTSVWLGISGQKLKEQQRGRGGRRDRLCRHPRQAAGGAGARTEKYAGDCRHAPRP